MSGCRRIYIHTRSRTTSLLSAQSSRRQGYVSHSESWHPSTRTCPRNLNIFRVHPAHTPTGQGAMYTSLRALHVCASVVQSGLMWEYALETRRPCVTHGSYHQARRARRVRWSSSCGTTLYKMYCHATIGPFCTQRQGKALSKYGSVSTCSALREAPFSGTQSVC